MGRSKKVEEGVGMVCKACGGTGKNTRGESCPICTKIEPVSKEIVVARKVETEALTITERANKLQIRTNEEYVVAGELLKVVKGLQAEVDAAFDPIIAAAHKAHKAGLDQKKKASEPLLKAEMAIKPKVAAYLNEQERVRREQQAEQDRKARQQAEEEAEQKRLRIAEELVAAGKMEEAQLVLEDKEIGYEEPERVVVQSEVPKVAGLSAYKIPVAEVTDIKLLVRAIADGKVPIQAIEINQTFLNNQAKQFKTTEGLNYPGVRVYEKDVVASGRA